MKPLTLATTACLAAVAISDQAFAWGDEGHEAVALIAKHYLTADAQAALTQLLGPTDPSVPADIASRATWADKYRASSPARYTATHNWHFVDLEIDGTPDMSSACFGHLHIAVSGPASASWPDDCVVDKIEQFRAELTSTATSPAERQLALQFLLHFVGDVHQPLHSADHHDAGGNAVYVVWGKRKTPSPLHSFWDDQAVSGNATTASAFASKALAAMTQTRCTALATGADQAGSSESWANDAYALAKSVAYGMLPKAYAGSATISTKSGPKTVQYYKLSATYVAKAKSTAFDQISAAGVRLAAVLNRVLANEATSCSV